MGFSGGLEVEGRVRESGGGVILFGFLDYW